MFEGLKDMGKLMKQAKEMKSRMKEVQDSLRKERVTVTALNGQIKVVVSGELDFQEINIDPSLLVADNADSLQSELLNAINSAVKQAKDMAASRLSAISGDINLPGL
jgi:nucleoid-associated protein EbfC